MEEGRAGEKAVSYSQTCSSEEFSDEAVRNGGVMPRVQTECE